MDEDKEYREAVSKFYEIYTPLAKAYNLRMHSHFSIYEGGLIEVYQYVGETKGILVTRVKAEDEEEWAGCYRRATEQLEDFEKRMDAMTRKVTEYRKKAI